MTLVLSKSILRGGVGKTTVRIKIISIVLKVNSSHPSLV